MSEEERRATPVLSTIAPSSSPTPTPATAATRTCATSIRRFVEAGVPGYHIEDQKPGLKKCGHQGGKVLVPVDEQIKRLNAARLQLDIMRVPGIIVARTDAESATFSRPQRRAGSAVSSSAPPASSCRATRPATSGHLKKFFELGVEEIRGHLLYALSRQYEAADEWLESTGLLSTLEEKAKTYRAPRMRPIRRQPAR